MNLWDSRGARRWRRNQYGGAIIRKLLITFRDERQNSFANRSGILWIFPLWDQCVSILIVQRGQRLRLRLLEGQQLDVAERHLPMIALEGDVAGIRLRKEGHPRELAPRDTLVEIVTAQNVIKVLHAVDVVFALLFADDQAHVVPLAGGFGGIEWLSSFGIRRWLIKAVKPAAADRIACLGVVLQLEFGACRPHAAAFIGDVVHDATISTLGDVIVQLQIKPIVLASGDDVARVVRINARQSAVLDLPAWPDALAFEVVPTLEVLAVEQKLPPGLFFRLS